MLRCLALLLLAVSSLAGARTPQWSGSAQVRVEITRRGNEWIADYQFDREYPVWVFPRTDVTRDDLKSWRPASWTVETRGVRLERRGSYDVLIANRGDVPRNVRIRFTPFTKGLQDDYTPALQFTDGSVALYIAQFDAFPMASVRDVKALPSDLNNQVVPDAKLTLRACAIRRGRSGCVASGRRWRRPTDKDAYVFFGSLQPIETPAMVGFVDPQLPEWIRGSLAQAIPDILARYTQELGRAARQQAHHHAELGRPDARAHEPRGQRAARPHRAHLRRLRACSRKKRERASKASSSSRTRPRISGWGRPSPTNTRATRGSPKAAPTC